MRRHGAAAKRGPKRAAETVELTVEAIGARGDGLARHQGRTVYVPLTVPGDRVLVRLGTPAGDGVRGELVELLAPGPGRQAAPCPQFGTCGGCTLQHLADDAYAACKMALLHDALGRVGLATVRIEPLVRTPAAVRRRARFAALRQGGRVLLGFNARLSHRLVDLPDCAVLLPVLVAALAPLRAALAAVLADGEGCDATLTALPDGLDLLLTGPRRLDLRARETLASLAAGQPVARVSWQEDERAPVEPVAHRRPVALTFGALSVVPPPGAFLQASEAGEAALQAAVLAGVAEAAVVADLFAGLGTFSGLLCPRPTVPAATVHAVEGDAAAVSALTAARLPGLTVERRDLFTQPLSPKELDRFEAVVFDPPRAGAAAQAAELAASRVPVVVAVSCNPATFARDARLLVDGGYRLERLTPVDQFLWSAHLELVGVFRR